MRMAFMLTFVVALGDELAPAAPERNFSASSRANDSELTLVAGNGVLSGGYGLEVTSAIPAPPQLVEGAAGAPGAIDAGCPFEVRAIVAAEASDDDFAVVAMGTESKLVHVGDAVKKNGVRIAIVAIEPHAVVARAADELVRCNFK